jgi:acyl-CoA synthetase (AMP-forming)/AMP-acid ligase II
MDDRFASRTHATLVEVLRSRAGSEPDAVVYTFLEGGEAEAASLTLSELDRRSREIGARLQSRFAAGERVLLVYPASLEFIAGFLGSFYGGVVPVPVYPPQSAGEVAALKRVVADSGARGLLTSRELLGAWEKAGGGRLGETLGLPTLVSDDLGAGSGAEAWRDPLIEGDTLAFLQYTSGSTGHPKGVMVSHAGLLSTCRDIDNAFRHDSGSVMVTWLPMFHDMGLIYGILLPLLVGFRCYLMSPLAFLRRPIRWLRAISRYGGTHSAAPNFAYDLCVRKTTERDRAGLDLSTWRVAPNGAEPIREATLQEFAEAFEPYGFRRAAFCPSYGLAEGTLKVSTCYAGEPPLVLSLDGDALERGQVVEAGDWEKGSVRLVSCGRSSIGAEILIVDPRSLNPCAAGRVGEIWVSSPSIALGYWNQPEETERTFRAFTADGRGPFLRTGDLGFILRSELFVTGRLKDLIILRGRNYYPQDIERTVEQTHAILRPGCGAAFQVPAEGEESLVVLQEARAELGAGEDAEELLRAIRQAIAREHRLSPSHVLLLPPGEIPKTSSGKVRRSECRRLFQEGVLSVIAEWHRTS